MSTTKSASATPGTAATPSCAALEKALECLYADNPALLESFKSDAKKASDDDCKKLLAATRETVRENGCFRGE